MRKNIRKSYKVLFLTLGLLLPSTSTYSAGLINEYTYKRLSSVHSLLDKEDYQKALTELDSLQEKVKGNQYALALVWHSYGYAYYGKGDIRQAISAFEKSVALNSLPQPTVQSTLISLVQLNMSVEQYEAALKHYELWQKSVETISADQYVLGGSLYLLLKRYPDAIIYLKKGIEKAEQPEENWYRNLLAIYYESERYADAARLLEEMISIFPDNKEYWMQLSGVYLELEKNDKSLAILHIAYERGLLTEESELYRLANLYVYQDIPYQAAKVLEAELADGHMQASAKNLELLSMAYMRAREDEKTIQVLERLASINDDPRIYLTIAQLYSGAGNWAGVSAALAKVVEKPEFDQLGSAYLLNGIAHYERNNIDEAIKSFERALGYQDVAKQAEGWLVFLNAS